MTVPEPDTIVWRTSSYSGHGADCVQVGWRISSYSVSGSACVEVASAPERVLVRDSKDPDGPALAVPPRPGGHSSPPSPDDSQRCGTGNRPRFIQWTGTGDWSHCTHGCFKIT